MATFDTRSSTFSFRYLGENETASDDRNEDKHDEEGHKPWVIVIGFTLLITLSLSQEFCSSSQ